MLSEIVFCVLNCLLQSSHYLFDLIVIIFVVVLVGQFSNVI